MEIPAFPALDDTAWTRVAPCERTALEMLRSLLSNREDVGGKRAVAGLGLFSVPRADAFEAYLSPGTAAALAPQLEGLGGSPSAPPHDEPRLRLVAGDVELWGAVVRGA